MYSLGKLRNRSLPTRRFEALEQRLALSSNPVVTAVEFGSTDWDSGFVDYLQDEQLGQYGLSVPLSSSQQQPLPWTNIDRIYITFSEDVIVDAADLAITGVNTSQYDVADFLYDPQLRTARWTLDQPIANDQVLLDLDADGVDPVTDLSGNVLDGNSGGKQSGGDFHLVAQVVPGDADRNTAVGYFDYIYVYFSHGKSTTTSGYNPYYDIDGSGVIDATDSSAAFGMIGTSLPTGDPAGATNDAPTTNDAAVIEIDDPALDEAFSLFGLFDDNEDADTALSLSVVSNSSPNLFDSVSINTSTGDLVMNAAAGASGRASIVVEVTDTGGLSVQQTLTVDVDYENQPPQITDFVIAPLLFNDWHVYLHVTDPDESTANWIVTFTGVFAERAVVYPDGWCEFVITLPPGSTGSEIATVIDSSLVVVEAETWVGLS